MIVILIGTGFGVAGYYLGSFLTVIFFYLFRLLSEFLFGTSMNFFPILFQIVDSGLFAMIFAGGIAGYVAQSRDSELLQGVQAWMLGLFCALIVIVLNLLILRSSEATPTGPAPIDTKVIVALLLNLPAGALGGGLGAVLCRIRRNQAELK